MSFADSLEYQITQRRVSDFTDEVMDDHDQAMDSLDCEDFLEKGIKAEEQLTRLEETLREAIYLGLLVNPVLGPGAKEALDAFYRNWLIRSEEANAWANRVIEHGYRPANLDRFLQSREAVELRVVQADWIERSAKSRRERFSEEPW